LQDGTPGASHPAFRPHLMQGWSPDFIPKLTEDAVKGELFDRILPVNGAESLRLARELAAQEGILTGITGGATFAGALSIARESPAGTTILCMLPDTGERYLSTPLFADVPSAMTDEEIELARSTPNYRFDVPATPAPAPATSVEPAAADPAAAAFVAETVGDADRPVVLFALEWCEFCWSVRRMFTKFGIEYRAVDLDSVAYQKDDWGGRIRAALRERTGMLTIPQVFVGGRFVGGATETFDAWRDGRMREWLEGAAVVFDRDAREDPYSFLPSWLHPR
jgi:cysteine synthase A